MFSFVQLASCKLRIDTVVCNFQLKVNDMSGKDTYSYVKNKGMKSKINLYGEKLRLVCQYFTKYIVVSNFTFAVYQ